MNKKSAFEVIPKSDIGYGPAIRRVEELDNDEVENLYSEYEFTSEAEPGDLSIKERGLLRGVLTSIGVKLKPSESEEVDASRRRFLRFGAAAVAAGGVAALTEKAGILSSQSDEFDNGRRAEGRVGSELVESAAEAEKISRFEAELEECRALLTLPKDTMLFVDDNGEPVGRPVKFEDIVDRKYNPDGSLYMEDYLFTPSRVMNELGVPEDGVSPEWMDLVQQRLEEKYPGKKIARRVHVAGEFMAGYRKGGPELQDKVESGEVENLVEMVDFFGEEKVESMPGLSRKEYLREMVEFSGTVPAVVQEEVRRLLPALSAKESQFSDTALSKSGAVGALQFKPSTWEDLGADPDKITLFEEQVKMMGEFTSRQYKALFYFVGKDRLNSLQAKFQDEDSYYRDLIVPLLINAHNTGAKGMADVVTAYLDATPKEIMPTGKDLYTAIADYGKENKIGGYGNEARPYAMMIYAYADEMKG